MCVSHAKLLNYNMFPLISKKIYIYVPSLCISHLSILYGARLAWD